MERVRGYTPVAETTEFKAPLRVGENTTEAKDEKKAQNSTEKSQEKSNSNTQKQTTQIRTL